MKMKMKIVILMAMSLFVITYCNVAGTNADSTTIIVETNNAGTSTNTTDFKITSSSSAGINPNENIQGWFRCAEHSGGQNDFPEVKWSNIPAGTKSFTYIIEDTFNSGWVHLNLYNIPANLSSLSKRTPYNNGYQFSDISGSSVGQNSWSTSSNTAPTGIHSSSAQIRPAASTKYHWF